MRKNKSVWALVLPLLLSAGLSHCALLMLFFNEVLEEMSSFIVCENVKWKSFFFPPTSLSLSVFPIAVSKNCPFTLGEEQYIVKIVPASWRYFNWPAANKECDDIPGNCYKMWKGKKKSTKPEGADTGVFLICIYVTYLFLGIPGRTDLRNYKWKFIFFWNVFRPSENQKSRKLSLREKKLMVLNQSGPVT